MKAISLDQPQKFRLIDTAEPAAPGPGDALVKVHRVGICGTDYGGYLGKMPFFSYPRIPGHELGVEVLAVGEGVTNVQPGDRCSVEPYLNCQKCYACRRGHTNCCEHNKTLGVMCDGGLAERYVLPARKLHISRQLTFDQLALVETLAIGCHAVNRGASQAGEHVLVIGAGPIGLSAIEFAKLSGARTIVMDMNAGRLAFVREKMGVPDTIELTPGGEAAAVEQLSAITNGQLADVVIDATGSNKSMSAALAYCAFAGRLVYVGITQQEVSFLHSPIMHRREVSIMASRNALPPDFKRIIALIEEGRIDTVPWITHHAAFDTMIDAFPGWLRPETGVIKAVVEVA
ncbi:Alcohol dehydrogenase GroES domain protein [Chthoniobacter flavus Ellin428]|uniref:Alcohol dehydrogenase GroES domain protein n=1 Tax=Chthoniobacter flavus Ellin428 TaxID=497964 RepID=B4D5X9_9BACT|nr:zinc-binding alcohol dehydrogenase family protein [Chthoniobacter flavus]EDY18182.1 Alcohol dehydrogenase GroES domain protein [Chthoniobacter flavus Ellin428]TCO91465.1 alcohol dehydrogenase [Chthoniobacter flavus]